MVLRPTIAKLTDPLFPYTTLFRSNAVAAGPTETEFLATRMGLTAEQVESIKAAERQQIPLGRRGQPEEVAQWIVSLAAPAVWMTGQVVAVDGGLNVA